MEKYQLMERVRRALNMLVHMRTIPLVNGWIQQAIEKGDVEAQTGLAHHVFGAVTVSIPEALHVRLDWEEERQVVFAAVVAIASEYKTSPEATKFALDGDFDSRSALEDRVTDRIMEQVQGTTRTFMTNDEVDGNSDVESRAVRYGYGSNA